MNVSEQLHLGGGRMRPVLQTEAAECGLACLAMLLGHYGTVTDLATLRGRHGASAMGLTLSDLARIAAAEHLATRALRLELDEVPQLRLPCVLHWDMAHFVVLVRLSGDRAVIYDPAVGERSMSMAELGGHFTGVALEAWPDPGFEKREDVQRVTLRALVGRITGLGTSLARVLVISLALEVVLLVTPLFVQWVTDHVLVSGDQPLLWTLAIGFALLAVLQQGLLAVRGWTLMALGTQLRVQWRSNVFTHLLRLPLDWFARRHLGDIVSRYQSIDTIQRVLTATTVEAVLDGLMMIVALVVMTLYSPLLTAVAVLAVALYALARALWFPRLFQASSERLVTGARQSSHFLETVRGARTIRLYSRQYERRAAWQTLMVAEVNAGLAVDKLQLAYRIVSGLLTGLFAVLVVFLAAREVLAGTLTVGMMLAFISYRATFDARVTSLVDRWIELRMLRLDAQRLADIVLSPTEPDAIGDGPVLADGPQPVAFEGVQFRYAPNAPWIIDSIDLEIPAGQSIAIAGPSGSGKTTLVNLLLGVYAPTAGIVRVGGQPLDQLGAPAWRRVVGTVMQDDVLFAGTIAENIAFFDARPDAAWIAECARLASVDEDIRAMPMGYQTLVGDMGTVLSGGQKQRVLLARALYKRPQLLVLDEATSHLDLARETAVNAHIAALAMTRIVIAHRPETIASVERVVEIGQGRIVADLPVDQYMRRLRAAVGP